jgi:rSAM/selenodomain-associated transferase 2
LPHAGSDQASDRTSNRPPARGTQRPTVAILIPTLDEEESLRRHLPAAIGAADEVVVSDGGSRDASPRLARELGARVVCGPTGRGGQLNRAAAAAGADVFLFLHADTTLPPGGVDAVRSAVGAGARGGGFLLRFDSDRPWMRLGARLVDLRTRLTRAPLGDQAQFVTRKSFVELGGFREWPILEDLDFIRRLRRRGRVAVLPLRVTTSARRYETGGVLRTVARNWLIWGLYLCGISPHRLARLYRHVR